ncbi:uncharacterized protein LOC117319611 [Pecten maximus]|uniref:uncharacterized protein LOC117319611 n=1 Tax=Pecten maximus TaxID=6579 RepID=UPI00145888E6|nr:uncharacterized protein LOC117319611 [Pecten maximus]
MDQHTLSSTGDGPAYSQFYRRWTSILSQFCLNVTMWTTDHLFSFIQTRKESGRRDVSGMLLCMMMLLGSSTPQTSSCMDQDHSTYLRTCRKCDLSLSTCSTPDINIFLPQLRSQQTSTEHPGICQFMLHVILKHYGISSASICKLIVQV